MNSTLTSKQMIGRINLKGTLNAKQNAVGEIGSRGTNTYYDNLRDRPQINDVVLSGNKTSKDLKLQDAMNSLTNVEIQKIWKEGKL